MSIIPILHGKTATQLPILPALTGSEILYVVSNTGVSSQATVQTFVDLMKHASTGILLAANNLSDLANKQQARANLGLGSLAIQNSGAVNITGGQINGTSIGLNEPALGKFINLEVTGNFILPPGSIDLSVIAGLIPNSKLEHSSFGINYTNGLSGEPNVSLGGNLNLSIDQVDGGNF